jgi:hypothetical protein
LSHSSRSAFEEFDVARDHAALALDRLDDHGGDVVEDRGARGSMSL